MVTSNLFDPYDDSLHTDKEDGHPFIVYAKATIYPDTVRVFIPRHQYAKNNPNSKHKSLNGSNYFRQKNNQESSEERSLRRTKQRIRDYLLCNNFDYFMSFTFKEDRYDEKKSMKKMNTWLKNQKKRWGKFKYVIVPERHSDDALHFHAVIGGFMGRITPAINPKTGMPIIKKGKPIYALPGYRLGIHDVRKIDEGAESRSKVARYISKYITKDMPILTDRHRYWASRNLKLPIVLYNPSDWYKNHTALWSDENEYGQTLIFPRQALADVNSPLINIMENDE